MTATTCCPICEGTGTRYYEWEERPQACALCRGTGRREVQIHRLAALPAAMTGASRVGWHREAVVLRGGKEAELLFDHRMHGGG
jgi:hypothetical protein